MSIGAKGMVTVTWHRLGKSSYTVTDVDGLTAKAAIIVPGTDERLSSP